MSNLPINNNLPSGSNAANALQANLMADTLVVDLQPAKPFAFLLAQQINVSETSLAAGAAQAALAGSGVSAEGNQPMKDSQDKSSITADMPADPAGVLATVLLQLPAQEGQGQKIDSEPSSASIPSTQSLKTGNLPTDTRLIGASKEKGNLQPFQLPDSGISQKAGSEKPAILSPDNPTPLPVAAQLRQEAARHPEGQHALSPLVPGPTPGALPASTALPHSSALMANTHAIPNDAPSIVTPLGNSGWADEFSQKVSWISTQQNQVAELHLNPPNLGPLDVVIKVSDNQATALFASPHSAVRDAVENALPKLREILADNGIMLGNATVSDQPPRERGQSEFANHGVNTTTPDEWGNSAQGADNPSADTMQRVAARRHNGMVDTFA